MEGLGFEETPSVTGWEMVIAPCTLLPVGAALLALTATIVVVKFARARPALAFSRSNLVVEHGAEPSMWTLRVQIGVSFALATTHAISLGVGIFLYPTPAPIVIDIAETIFTIVWISIAVGKTT